MTKLNKLEQGYNECQDKYTQTVIKLNDAVKANIVKDNEIDKLSTQVRDLHIVELSNSLTDSDIINGENTDRDNTSFNITQNDITELITDRTTINTRQHHQQKLYDYKDLNNNTIKTTTKIEQNSIHDSTSYSHTKNKYRRFKDAVCPSKDAIVLTDV